MNRFLKPSSSAPVYSTEHGRMCPHCRSPVAQCSCKQQKAVPKTDGVVRIRLETKGRKGKGVTLVEGVPLAGTDLEAFGKQLKQRCGSGGTVKEGVIEIQGDHRELAAEVATGRGWKVKRAGG